MPGRTIVIRINYWTVLVSAGKLITGKHDSSGGCHNTTSRSNQKCLLTFLLYICKLRCRPGGSVICWFYDINKIRRIWEIWRIAAEQVCIYCIFSLYALNIEMIIDHISCNCVTLIVFDLIIRICCCIWFFLQMIVETCHGTQSRVWYSIHVFCNCCQKQISIRIISGASGLWRISRTVQPDGCRIQITGHIDGISFGNQSRIDKCAGIIVELVSIISQIICHGVGPVFSIICRSGNNRINSAAIAAFIPADICRCHQCAIRCGGQCRNTESGITVCGIVLSQK